MNASNNRHVAAVLLLAAIGVTFETAGAAQDQEVLPQSQARTSIGVQGLGLFGVGWPAASKTIEAVGLDPQQMDFGAGLQITNLWRNLFSQVIVTRSSATGERAFVDADGTVFRLGIPLSVRSTYVDVGAGWKFPVSRTAIPYVAAGVGNVRYKESDATEVVEESVASYHVEGGVEVRLGRWVAVSGDIGYRHVPDLFGAGGISGAFQEDEAGGVRAGVALRLILRDGGRRMPTAREDTVEPNDVEPRQVPGAINRESSVPSATTTTDTPVFLRMDATGEPLRTLEPGTVVRVIAELGEWVRIEFQDRLLGSRVGYVNRNHLRIPKQMF